MTEDTDTDEHIVTMENIHKSYGEVVALNGVDMRLRDGEILGLAGDNGAGKTTLIKCLAGVHSSDEGHITLRGEQVTIETPGEAKRLGIETTFQELAVVNNLTVTENIFLGREDTIGGGGLFGILKRKNMRRKADELLSTLGIGVDPEAKTGNLSGGERQLVAISRTMLSDPDIVIMDEPTSALSVEGAKQVLNLIDRMKEQGISILLISHSLDYLMEVTDRIQVLHNGQNAGTFDTVSVSQDTITTRMVSGSPSGKEVPPA